MTPGRVEVLAHLLRHRDDPSAGPAAVERARLRLLGQHATAELAEVSALELSRLSADLPPAGPR